MTQIIILLLAGAAIGALLAWLLLRRHYSRLAAQAARRAMDIPPLSPLDDHDYIKTTNTMNAYLNHRWHLIHGPFDPCPTYEFFIDRNRILEQFCRMTHRVGCEVYLKAVSRHDIEQAPEQADSHITHMQHVRDNEAYEILTGHSYPDVR